MSEHDATAHASADDEYLPKPGSSYEHTDADTWTVSKFALWITVFAVLVHFAVGFTFHYWSAAAMNPGEPRYPLAVNSEPQQPPLPRLQQDPAREVGAFRAGEETVLHSYGWVDKNAGIAHMPIEDAMKMTLERGLPVREGTVAPAETPGLMPSDGSAGRVMERRRQ